MPVAKELGLGDIIQELQKGGATKSNTPTNPLVNDKIVCFGDSITMGNIVDVRQYPTWLGYYTESTVKNAGVNGNTLAQMLTRIDADVIALRPGICVILGGTNDINQSRTLEEITSSMSQITAKLRAAGIIPIWCTIPPRSDNLIHLPTIRKLNTWLYAHCANQGVMLIDIYTEFTNADGTPKDWYLLADKLHPTAHGMMRIARLIAEVLPRSQRQMPTAYFGEQESIAPNPRLLGIEVATSWAKYGSAGNLLKYSLEPHIADKTSNWQVIRKETGPVAQTAGIRVLFANQIVAGKTYRVEVDLDLKADGDIQLPSYFAFKDSTGATIGSVVYVLRQPTLSRLDNIRVATEITAPAGTTSCEWVTFGNGVPAFTLKFGRPRIIEYYSAP
ncbi:GDSL-type esterase/lipase family protein [Paenibacillus sp. SC116]|nr:GDSL-type esterase/lipase family protein [Paenibacillus sp. SC116]